MSESEKEWIRKLIMNHKWPLNRHNSIDHNRQLDILAETIDDYLKGEQ